MSYHENPRINGALLVAINDGAGDQCGRSYQERVQIAAWSGAVWPWVPIVRAAGAANGHKLTLDEGIQGATLLRDYYKRHVAEMAR